MLMINAIIDDNQNDRFQLPGNYPIPERWLVSNQDRFLMNEFFMNV